MNSVLVIAGRELRAYMERPFAWLLGALGLVPIGIHLGARTFS